MAKKILSKNINKIAQRSIKRAPRTDPFTLKKLNITAPQQFHDDLVMADLGITMEAEKKDFSLKSASNDKESIHNPKIVELDNYKRTENEYDKPDDKFPNEDDPFYELDEQREKLSPIIKKQQVTQFSKSKIVNSLVSNRALKQLKY